MANILPAAQPTRWGQRGISEHFINSDTSLPIVPGQSQLSLADAGLLSEIIHHVNANSTMTHGTGTNALDVYGPYNLISNYLLSTGNVNLVNLSGRALAILNILEYVTRNWEKNADGDTVMNPLTNSSDYFNFGVGTSGTANILRYFQHVPLSLPLAGAPGGRVGYVSLQTKRTSTVVKPTFAVTGSASPYSVAATSAGTQPFDITGNDTVTLTGNLETWKQLNTLPQNASDLPIFGYQRQMVEYSLPYTSGNFTYNVEASGDLLRLAITFYDATVKGGMATTNLNNLQLQYGIGKIMDNMTPNVNIHQQQKLYGRTLPQGTFVLDYYTATRSLAEVKSTENTANLQVVANFASGYSVPANSTANILIDRVVTVQPYIATA